MTVARRLWLRAPVGPVTWSVYLAPPNDPLLSPPTSGDDPLEGFAQGSRLSILINDALPPERRWDVLVHELMHAAMYMLSGSDALGIDHAREEAIIGLIAPLLAQSMAAIVRLPVEPKSQRRSRA